MAAYYNEIDPYAAQWLRNLIAKGLIAPGDVDERSITDVQPDDVRGYDQCHFFAGIGGWSLALRLAGVADDYPVWTGSCPCQPLSGAGLRKGHADERHLWPAFHRLIAECAPPVVFGEQVASKDGREWLAGVRADLERLGYACGGADLCAAGLGAPHIRQRLFWVGYSERKRPLPAKSPAGSSECVSGRPFPENGEGRGRLADSSSGEDQQEQQRPQANEGWWRPDSFGRRGLVSWVERSKEAVSERNERRLLAEDAEIRTGARNHAGDTVTGSGRLGDAENAEYSPCQEEGRSSKGPQIKPRGTGCIDWASAIWIPCADGKARRLEPSIEPLAHGVPARVGRLRAYGNAIVPQVAAEFVRAAL